MSSYYTCVCQIQVYSPYSLHSSRMRQFNLIGPLLFAQILSVHNQPFTIPLVMAATYAIWKILQIAKDNRVPCSAQCLSQPLGVHCRHCDMCTKGFDHHCWWLGTCVVRDNYLYFISLLVSLYMQCFLGIIRKSQFSYFQIIYSSGFLYLNIILIIHLLVGGRR
ncbi:Palmitoyltransferase [Spironucleus salmonicida]|uniref:Palmitoyltransferase n=1 Tax=Spironucleus salmonicida TaxID=348837 RepID=V6LFN5_9EUKA|nr:Palmitoyltransferase [Spironucleus salmonicida]|eukprot:EST43103.1 DHHC zinc finger and transmembrane domain-containing protein [Spironucleus salmonicida]